MKMMQIWVALTLFSATSTSIASQQERLVKPESSQTLRGSEKKDSGEIWHKLEGNLELNQRVPGTDVGDNLPLIGQIEFENIECGKNYEIDLTVKNASSRIVEFDRSVPGCSCSKFRFEKNVIGPGVSTLGKMRVKVPLSSAESELPIVVALAKGEAEIAQVVVTMKLVGNFAVLANSIIVDPGIASTEMRIPLVYSFPVRKDTISFEIDKEVAQFVDSSIEFGAEGKGCVVLKVKSGLESSDLVRSAASGNITLYEKVGGAKIGVSVVVREWREVTIHPDILSFRKEEANGEETGFLIATAMLKKNREVRIDSIQLRMGDVLADLSVVPITESVSRVKVRVLKEKIVKVEEDGGKMEWEVRTNGGGLNIQGLFGF